MSIDVDEGDLRVSVSDHGPGFDAVEAMSQAKGLGLGILDSLSRDWGVERRDSATEVWFRI
jgi:anti-sigma regulatory factor (Ser/Thr protein kinase)